MLDSFYSLIKKTVSDACTETRLVTDDIANVKYHSSNTFMPKARLHFIASQANEHECSQSLYPIFTIWYISLDFYSPWPILFTFCLLIRQVSVVKFFVYFHFLFINPSNIFRLIWCVPRFYVYHHRNQNNVQSIWIAVVEIIQWHKPTMIGHQRVRFNIIIQQCKMEICHSNQFHRPNRKIIARWFQAMAMQPTEICLVNGIQRFV